MEKKRNFSFATLKENEYYVFATKHKDASFLQTVELANLKKELGSIPHFLGVKEKNKVVAATLILEEEMLLGQKSFYAPRGYLVDYNDFELLKYFCEQMDIYVKKHKGFRIIIDPNVIYQIRNSDGSQQQNEKNDILIDNLAKLGYRHFGFNLYSEALQMRWEYRLKLDRDYENIRANYSKSTRKNIDLCYKKGVEVRKGNEKDLPVIANILEETSIRKDFKGRNLEYYEKMYHHMNDLMTLYIAHLDADAYYQYAEESLARELENQQKIEEKMKVDMVGNKLRNQLETSERLIVKYQEELKKAKHFRKEYPHGKDIGALLSLKSGEEYLTLSSGILEEYKAFTPKYAMYDQHIKDAIEQKNTWVDFYGINGCFDKNDPYYGIYEFKKGFNGNVVELVGQFEKKVTEFHTVYNIGKRIKKILKIKKN